MWTWKVSNKNWLPESQNVGLWSYLCVLYQNSLPDVDFTTIHLALRSWKRGESCNEVHTHGAVRKDPT